MITTLTHPSSRGEGDEGKRVREETTVDIRMNILNNTPENLWGRDADKPTPTNDQKRPVQTVRQQPPVSLVIAAGGKPSRNAVKGNVDKQTSVMRERN